VALEAVFGEAQDRDAAAGDGRGGEEVAGGRGVRLDVVPLDLHRSLIAGDAIDIGEMVFNVEAPPGHHSGGHLHIGLRHKRSVDVDGYVLPSVGGHHEEGAEELAAHVPADANLTAGQSFALDDHGRATVPQLAPRVDSELP